MKLRNLILTAVVMLLVACTRQTLPTQAPIESITDFESALEKAGVPVERVGGRAPEIPYAEGQIWGVRGDMVVVYTFDENADRDQALDELTGPGTDFAERGQEIQIWERESFLVVYPGSEGGVVLLLSGLLGDPRTRQVRGPDEPYPPAISAAQNSLSKELGMAPSEISVVDYEPVTWPDSCLGLYDEGEACTDAEMSGWRIELSADGRTYVLHSDAIGSRVKRAN